MALSQGRAPMTLLAHATVLVFVTTFFLASPASADLVNKTGQLTVFWGRHKAEGSLREACDSGMYVHHGDHVLPQLSIQVPISLYQDHILSLASPSSSSLRQ
ncbi:hypothetical protein EJB05_25798, partial [Eragrostis curvula]